MRKPRPGSGRRRFLPSMAGGSTIFVQWLRQLFSPPTPSSGSGCKRRESAFERLPLDIVHLIHSLLPLKDAARAACVSHVFLRAWRCYSNLTLNKTTLGLTGEKYNDTDSSLITIVDHILGSHSGIGLEIFSLDLRFCRNIDDFNLDIWLQIVVHLGVKELSLLAPSHMKKEYSFPCSVLSDEAAVTIQTLDLNNCAFRPTEALGCLRRLRMLRLSFVDITDEGLGHLLSKSPALEQIYMFRCNKIICLRIPCTLQKLIFLGVVSCGWLQSIDINAPKLSVFHCVGTPVKDISVGDPWQLKDVHLSIYSPCHTLSFACARLPAVARNVESLELFSLDENFNTPMLVSKFPYLKKLKISIQIIEAAFSFDVLSLVSFLDASPALESLIIHLGKDVLRHDDSVLGGDNANYLTWKPQCGHDRLRQVTITGFRSNKNLIQFVIYIVESAPLLECLTLDTTPGYAYPRKCGIIGKMEKCSWMSESSIVDAHRAVKAANRYLTQRIPTGARFQVLEPCNRCHIRRWW